MSLVSNLIRLQRDFLLSQQALIARQLSALAELETPVLVSTSTAAVTSSGSSTTLTAPAAAPVSVPRPQPQSALKAAQSQLDAKQNKAEAKAQLQAAKKEAAATIKAEKAAAKKTKEVDPNRPKRPPAAFFLYQNEQFPHLKPKFLEEGLTHNDMQKKIGTLWAELPQAEKDVFLKRAEVAKLKYTKDVEEYDRSKQSGSIEESVPVPVVQTNVGPSHKDLPGGDDDVSEKKSKKKKRKHETLVEAAAEEPIEDVADEDSDEAKKKRKKKHKHRAQADDDEEDKE